MSPIDPVTTGSQELEKELVSKSSLHNVFSEEDLEKKKRKKTCTVKKDTVNQHPLCTLHIYVCVRARKPEVIAHIIPRGVRRVPKKK